MKWWAEMEQVGGIIQKLQGDGVPAFIALQLGSSTAHSRPASTGVG